MLLTQCTEDDCTPLPSIDVGNSVISFATESEKGSASLDNPTTPRLFGAQLLLAPVVVTLAAYNIAIPSFNSIIQCQL